MDTKKRKEQEVRCLDWQKESWEPFEVERIIESKHGALKLKGTVLKTGKNLTISFEINFNHIKNLYKNVCHIKIHKYDKITLSTFKLSQETNDTTEIDIEGILDKITFDSTNKKLCKLQEIWIKMQISYLKNDYKKLDHLIEYKGVHQKLIEYFGNIYMDIHENWMQHLKVKYDLSYPKTPSKDWFVKLKLEQKELEKKYKKISDYI